MFSAQWQQLLRLVPWFKATARSSRSSKDDEGSEQATERPLGCGWFDSSHDLRQGLHVREADSRVLALLPLADWLTLELTTCNEADTTAAPHPGIIAA